MYDNSKFKVFNIKNNNFIWELTNSNSRTYDSFNNSLCQLENGNIALSAFDGKHIQIISITKNTITFLFFFEYVHCSFLTKIISLPNNQIASCSSGDCLIKIWKGDVPFQSAPIKTIKFDNSPISNILYMKNKNCFISISNNGTLRVFNRTTRQYVYIFSEIKTWRTHNIIFCKLIMIELLLALEIRFICSMSQKEKSRIQLLIMSLI